MQEISLAPAVPCRPHTRRATLRPGVAQTRAQWTYTTMTAVASKFCGASDGSAVLNKLVEYAGAILLWMNVIQLPLALLGSNLRS
jgi:hypothetical protein